MLLFVCVATNYDNDHYRTCLSEYQLASITILELPYAIVTLNTNISVSYIAVLSDSDFSISKGLYFSLISQVG